MGKCRDLRSEVKNPQKNFPKALALSLLIIMLSYVFRCSRDSK